MEDTELWHAHLSESVCWVTVRLHLKRKGGLLSRYKELYPGSETMFAVL